MNEKVNKVLYIALSLLLAVLFWLFVDNEQGSRTSETFYRVPIEFVGAEDVLPSRGLMLVQDEDVTIALELSGPRLLITSLKKEDIRVQVNLTGITAVGTYPCSFDVLFPDEVDSSKISREWASRSTVTRRLARST